MQFAVLADIHGNLPALKAVARDIERFSPDLVFVAGDFQNRGPNPREVTEFVAQRGWTLLRGNHEDYVIRQSQYSETEDNTESYNWLPARWTANLTRDFVDLISRLPIATTLTGPDKLLITIAHGSKRSNAEGFFPTTPEAKAKEMIGNDPPSLLCVGHSHLPFVRRINETLVVNVGSVGFPFDGDQRACYGLVTWNSNQWKVDLRRIEYEVAKVVEEFERVKFYQGAGPLSYVIRRELESARPHLSPFEYLFGPPLRNGKLSVPAAVEAYMGMSQKDIEDQFIRVFKK